MIRMDLDELRQIAQAATPGPWRAVLPCGDPESLTGYVLRDTPQSGPMGLSVGDADGEGSFFERDAAHVAAFDPPTVLALLDAAAERDELRKERDELLGQLIDIDSERYRVLDGME